MAVELRTIMAYSHRFTLMPEDMQRLASLCGQNNHNINWVERELQVNIRNRGNMFYLTGEKTNVEQATKIIYSLYDKTASMPDLSQNNIHMLIQETKQIAQVAPSEIIHLRACEIRPRTPNQNLYVQQINQFDINFGIGPAGSGKTYLAVACAVEALEKHQVERIILVRPAVEAGERLGFLPGDLAQKVDPYLRPLYDALFEMLGVERVTKLIEKNIIEIAPLAYMRGRTLNDAFIILDESQNTTKEQMKMFLTRLGFNSRAVITGDLTQIDLLRGVTSGLKHTLEVLKGVEGIGLIKFEPIDIVRHPLVQKIVIAYDKFEQQEHEKDR